jgi:glycerophosphoryl diester phosphodiesterase
VRIIAAAVTVISASAVALGVGVASASPVQGRAPVVAPAAASPTNPWLRERVLNMAHSGGEHEAPMNTLYAFKRAAALGADMLELDIQVTADDQVVVLHNATVDETTNGTGGVRDMTLAQVQALDAAYWFVPGLSARHGRPASDYTLRGARTGAITVPGYSPDDFAIPTLAAVLEAFPTTPINIEIKGTADSDTASYLRCGRLLADLLNASGRTDIIVGSFNDAALEDFHARAPQIPISAARGAMPMTT